MDMGVIIGRNYEQTKLILRERIRNGSIGALESIATNHACYFCTRSIDGKMWILIKVEQTNGKPSESVYFADNYCYNRAILYWYYHNIPLSLN